MKSVQISYDLISKKGNKMSPPSAKAKKYNEVLVDYCFADLQKYI
jgi:hypothetical protein